MDWKLPETVNVNKVYERKGKQRATSTCIDSTRPLFPNCLALRLDWTQLYALIGLCLTVCNNLIAHTYA